MTETQTKRSRIQIGSYTYRQSQACVGRTFLERVLRESLPQGSNSDINDALAAFDEAEQALIRPDDKTPPAIDLLASSFPAKSVLDDVSRLVPDITPVQSIVNALDIRQGAKLVILLKARSPISQWQYSFALFVSPQTQNASEFWPVAVMCLSKTSVKP